VWEAKRECVVAVHLRNVFLIIREFGVLLPAYILCVFDVQVTVHRDKFF